MKSSVLVIGAGPGGVSSSYFLKKYDTSNVFDVELVDRIESEKYKLYHDTCGEAVSTSLLDDIQPLRPDGIIGKIKKINEHWPKDITIVTKMDGLLLDRPKFFKSIISDFEMEGGIFNKKKVNNISQKNGKVKVEFNDGIKSYDYVIAADGANSLVRRKLGLTGRTQNFLQYIVDKQSSNGVLSFFYDEKYKGDYKWIFPHENKVKIGFPLIPGSPFSLEAKIIRKQARTIGYGGLNQYAVGNILLVGDAACQTNPITKGGIRPAMNAGKKAAMAILSHDPKKYEQEWTKSDFSSPLFLRSFEKLKQMDNKALQHHIEPFVKTHSKKNYQRFFEKMKFAMTHRQYLEIYKAYDLSNKVGW
jgi:flavin-dependent dehydrogenase